MKTIGTVTSSAVQSLEGMFMRVNDVVKVLPISRSAWWKGVKEGRYPRGLKLGPRITVWRRSDITDLATSL